MCERSTLAFQEVDRDVAGDVRRVALYKWVADDLAAGDRELTRALGLWHSEVVTRLPARRPMKIRIPLIFFGALRLSSPFVLLKRDKVMSMVDCKGEGRLIEGERTLWSDKTK
ncbi:MAG: hypothetical protein Greene101449_1299 [Candidatus Peregrinibacteria bacterium Greene1014_49]|nr:MAG: hypothetical protein Greene101449_1299 [Candidatus Peregrinibacteria bacterium Greene1014_49]